MRNRLMILVIICLSNLLTACGQDSDVKSLKSYINTVKARRSTQIEPIPEVVTMEKYAYPNVKRRNPFQQVVEQSEVSNNGPDETRPKEVLEQFPLDSIKMVGTLVRDGDVWAIVAAPNGIFYRVGSGKYIGQNYGKITQVTEKQILVDELVNLKGGWQRRPTKIDLVEGS